MSKQRIVVLVSSVLVVFFGASLAVIAAAPVATQKIDRFVQDVTKAGSLEELSAAYEKARFSVRDRKELEKKLKDPRYKRKIEQLVNRAPKGPRVAEKKTPMRATATRARSEQALRPKLVKARTKAKQRQHAAVRGVRSVTAQDMAMMRATTGPGSTARITRISPSAGRPGTDVTITGSGFGGQGRVAVIVGRTNVDQGNLAFADVRSWTASRIVATLPSSIQSLVGETEKSGIVWVKLAGGELGPYVDFRFQPDLAALTPVISEVDPDPIYPDSSILITGDHFLADHRPTVRASAAGVEVTLVVSEWGDDYVYVTSGSDHRSTLARIPSGGFTISVQNHLGQTGTKALTMARRMARRTLTYGHAHRQQCEVWNSDHDRPSVFCLAGNKKTFTFPYARCRDWNVIGYSVQIRDRGCCSGYSFKKEPFGSDPSYRVELWANAWGYIELEVDVEMEGPDGTGCW